MHESSKIIVFVSEKYKFFFEKQMGGKSIKLLGVGALISYTKTI